MEALQTEYRTLVSMPPAVKDYPGVAPIQINRAWCKSCDICSALCPHCVIEPDWERKPIVTHPEECTQCGVCWAHCPDFAITSNFN